MSSLLVFYQDSYRDDLSKKKNNEVKIFIGLVLSDRFNSPSNENGGSNGDCFSP